MKNPASCSGILFLFLLFCLIIPFEALAATSSDRPVIIVFKKKPGVGEKNLLTRHKGRMRRSFRLLNAFSATIPEKEIKQLRKDPTIKYIEEDSLVTSIEPEMTASLTDTAWGIPHIGCDLVHAQGVTGKGVKIAVIDTGIDYTHPQLAASYAGGYDFVYDDNDPYEGWNSHGSHVAGIIAASALAGTDVIGGAPDASIYSLKVLDSSGSGLTSGVIAALDWAVEHDIDVVNLSISGIFSTALQDACASAYASGLLLVAAGGNTYSGAVRYPAAYASVIAVSASDENDLPAIFSPTAEEVELMAPGVSILSTGIGGGYDILSGTSQASPHVAAVAALMLSGEQVDVNQDGVVDNLDIRLRLQQSAIDLDGDGRDDVYGYGIVSARSVILDDGDVDGDVDGRDLFLFAEKLNAGSNPLSLEEFAARFAR